MTGQLFFEQRVAAFAEAIGLKPTNVIVALSGGADSVALLRVLLSHGYKCIAAHCNFKLRGEESDRDERFAIQLCDKLNVPLKRVAFDVGGYKRDRHVSTEMACRELRYEWFEQLRKQHNCRYIVVAHHRDDNIETLLLNAFRGTGITGLCGIKPMTDTIVRPLLCVDKNEILAYLAALGQDYITDSTNLEIDYARNKIRNRILPMIYEMFPDAKQGLTTTLQNIGGDFKLWQDAIAQFSKVAVKEFDGVMRINRQALSACRNAETMLHAIIAKYGFVTDQIKTLATIGRVGAIIESKGNFIAEIGREDIFVFKNVDEFQEIRFQLNQEEMPASLTFQIEEFTNKFVFEKDRNIAYFDSEIMNKHLILRRYRSGDSFYPFGMTGRQKLSDFFNNNKYSLYEKRKQLLLEADGRIVWVVGKRATKEFVVTKSTTKVVILRYKECK